MPVAPRPRAPRLLAGSVASLLAMCVVSCASSGPKELTKEEKLGIYIENAGRWFQLGEIDRAQDQAERALELDPGNERFLLIKGRCLQLRGTWDDLVEGEKLYRAHPAQDDARIQLGLAGCLERLGTAQDQSARAIAAGERYTDAADPEARANELRADAHAKWEEALERYALAEDLFSGDLEALNGLVRTSAFLGRTEESRKHARRMLETLDASTRLLKSGIETKERTGDSTVADRKSLLTNLDLEAEVRLLLADLHQKDGDLTGALAEMDMVLALQPERPEIHARRGQLLFELGFYGRARSALERYLQLSKDPFEHPNIRQAYNLISRADAALSADAAADAAAEIDK